MYKQVAGETGVVQNLATSAFIPKDENNTQWRECQLWLASGNTLYPEDTMTDTECVEANVPSVWNPGGG